MLPCYTERYLIFKSFIKLYLKSSKWILLPWNLTSQILTDCLFIPTILEGQLAWEATRWPAWITWFLLLQGKEIIQITCNYFLFPISAAGNMWGRTGLPSQSLYSQNCPSFIPSYEMTWMDNLTALPPKYYKVCMYAHVHTHTCRNCLHPIKWEY